MAKRVAVAWRVPPTAGGYGEVMVRFLLTLRLGAGAATGEPSR